MSNQKSKEMLPSIGHHQLTIGTDCVDQFAFGVKGDLQVSVLWSIIRSDITWARVMTRCVGRALSVSSAAHLNRNLAFQSHHT